MNVVAGLRRSVRQVWPALVSTEQKTFKHYSCPSVCLSNLQCELDSLVFHISRTNMKDSLILLLFMVTALFSHRLEATTLNVDLAQNVGKVA